MGFWDVANQVVVLFIILFAGYIAGKTGIIDDRGSKNLSGVLLYITSPMLVLKSFFIDYSRERLTNILWIMAMAFITYFLAIFLAKLIYGRFSGDANLVLRFTAIFSNSGYMGLPIIRVIFGEEGVLYASFYIVAFNIMLWTYGFFLFGGKGTKKQVLLKVLANPSIVAVYIGTIIFIFGIKLPWAITEAVRWVGDMTMPLSMLIIGAVISTVKLISVFSDWRVYLSSAVRLIVMPMLAFGLTRIPGIPGEAAAVLVTVLAMPAATNTTIFSEMFDKDAALASKCVTVSTLLSVVTIPAIVSLLPGM